MQVDEVELKRMVWRSRRGLLELDLQLTGFVRDVLPTLKEEEQEVFRDLLLVSDNDFLEYLNGKTVCPDTRLASMIERIRATRRIA
ncbi:MAG: succinate dehydrogenase assembly factor 2 [Formivibrio sp.]|nr:succinate dehydrogenase assembly factor 2 [Formivibrio sp.]